MQSSWIVRLAAFCTSVFITVVMVQSVALLGHPKPATDTQIAQTATRTAPAR